MSAGPGRDRFNLARDVINWLILRVMAPFGAASPAEQTATSLVLAVIAWLSSVITLGVSIILALVFTFTFLWGMYRIFTEGPTAGGWAGSVQNSGGTI
jgi:hypothetical protein